MPATIRAGRELAGSHATIETGSSIYANLDPQRSGKGSVLDARQVSVECSFQLHARPGATVLGLDIGRTGGAAARGITATADPKALHRRPALPASATGASVVSISGGRTCDGRYLWIGTHGSLRIKPHGMVIRSRHTSERQNTNEPREPKLEAMGRPAQSRMRSKEIPLALAMEPP